MRKKRIPGVGAIPEELRSFMETLRLPPGECLTTFLAQFDEVMNGRRAKTTQLNEVLLRRMDDWVVNAHVWAPTSGQSHPVVLLLHGGGWTTGSPWTHRGLASTLAAAGFVCVVPDYRRAPRHRFPAAFLDCQFALRWCRDHVQDHGGDPKRIAVMGDSAGANLAAAVAVADKANIAKAAALLYGIYDYHRALPILGDVVGGVTAEGQTYLRPADFETLRFDRRLSPGWYAEELPPTYIGVGDRDPLFEESRSLRVALEKAGGICDFEVLTGAPHGWAQLSGLDEYGPAINRLVAFLERTLTAEAVSDSSKATNNRNRG